MTDETLVYNPPAAAACMILLHGLGASSNDLYPLAEHLYGGNLRVICPQAPTQAVTCNGGWQMPAWYDIAGTDLADRQDAPGIAQSAKTVTALLAAETARGTPPENIFLAGFSQGAAMSLYSGLRHPQRLAGIVVLSGYMLLGETLAAQAAAANRQTPIFQAHGIFDPVVLPQWAKQCRTQLQDNGWPLAYKEYPIAHAIAAQTLTDLNQWLKPILARSKKQNQRAG